MDSFVEPDAGRGLALRGHWLVSAPTGARARWLAPWIQHLIAEGWNLATLAAVRLAPHARRAATDRTNRACAALALAAGAWFAASILWPTEMAMAGLAGLALAAAGMLPRRVTGRAS